MISQRAVVESRDIGEGTNIGDFAVVAAGTKLGRECVIHPSVVINSGVVLGDRVEVFPGCGSWKRATWSRSHRAATCVRADDPLQSRYKPAIAVGQVDSR